MKFCHCNTIRTRDIKLRKINQRGGQILYDITYVESKKIKQVYVYNKTETYRFKKQTNGYQ